MKTGILLSALVCTLLILTPAVAMERNMHDMGSMPEHRMHVNAPAGVMGAHTHHAGGWMFSYRYMYMGMHGNRDGTEEMETKDVLKDFMVAPTEMTMQMHMLGIMYAFSDDISVMAMFPYLKKEMEHVTRMGMKFTARTDGIGDIKLTPMVRFLNSGPHQLMLGVGFSFPTGSIDERGDTPVAKDAQLPYPMQLGSGTFDLLPSVSYIGMNKNWSWGSQMMANIRLGENSNDYTLGNRYGMTVWFARKITEWLGASVRIDGQLWKDIEGADPLIKSVTPMMMQTVPTADTKRRRGRRVDALLGIDISSPGGAFKGASLMVEGGVPVYQALDGPQLETDWLLTAGLKLPF